MCNVTNATGYEYSRVQHELDMDELAVNDPQLMQALDTLTTGTGMTR